MRNLAIVFVFLIFTGVGPAFAQKTQLLGTARSVVLKSDVVFNKNIKFNSNPIPFSYLYRAGLLRQFHEVISNPDIIIKIHKDVLLIGNEKLSLTVFDPEDNSVIYSEERDLLDEENDINRLVAHFLAKVKIERNAVVQAATEAKRAQAAEFEAEKEAAAAEVWREKDKNAFSEAKIILTFYSSSESLKKGIIEANRNNPNEYHIYLREVKHPENADVVFEEDINQGIYTLTLRARDTKEVLHSERVPEKSSRRAISFMSKWITSTPWE